MALSVVSAETSDATSTDTFIDSRVYIAAISPHQKGVDSSKLKENLYRVTAGGRNTVLHLASAAGNLPFIQQVLRLDHQSGFVDAANVTGNTALHEAAQRGHLEVVVELLLHQTSLVNMHNKLEESPLFKACEGGHSKIVEKLLEADPSKLLDKCLDGRTCLHAVVNGGHADLLSYLFTYIEKNLGREKRDLLKQMDKQGNTVLHLAARRNRQDMVTRLLASEPGLSYAVNHDKETAICVAVKLGFLPVVEGLVNCNPDSIEIASNNGKNILHLAVELSQMKILQFLVKRMDLSQLINQKMDLSQLINQPDEALPRDGDTPLHIAARNKDFYMVELLLKVRGVNKDAVNSAGLTPFDIARENTEYHESFKIIEMLSANPSGRASLYSTPTMSLVKKRKAMEIVDNFFANRRDVELVVAALLATMTFSAVFTVPGGFNEDSKNSTKQDSSALGVPMLIGYDSFKLFLVFDCVAFFLSLFVVLVWEMSTPLTTRDKMLFICVTNAVLCSAFAFTAYGLMAAVYTVLAHKVKMFAWVVLGSSMFIAFCGNVAFFYMAVKFTVIRARFHRLCGVPRFADEIVESVWVMAEKHGILYVVRSSQDFFHGLVSGDSCSCVCRKNRTTTTKGLH